jgi:hypothetical protein
MPPELHVQLWPTVNGELNVELAISVALKSPPRVVHDTVL